MSLFLGGAFVATVIVFIFLPLFVFKPRLDELTQERNDWRARALHLEDSAQAQVDDDYKIIGHFGAAVSADDLWENQKELGQ